MREYDRNKPLISIHIPKCGGTSFRAVLRDWFGRKLYMHYFSERWGRMPRRRNLRTGVFRREFKKGICIHGHFNKHRGFGVRDYYPEVDQFITILREPFEIALSNYFYIKKLDSKLYRDGKVVRARDQYADIGDYFRQHGSYIMDYMPHEMNISNYKEIIERDFVYIGILEDLQTSVDMLAERLGFRKVVVPLTNISERDEQIPEHIKEHFISNHQLEYAIYRYALANYKR